MPQAPFWSSPADFDAALRAMPGPDTDAIAASAARKYSGRSRTCHDIIYNI